MSREPKRYSLKFKLAMLSAIVVATWMAWYFFITPTNNSSSPASPNSASSRPGRQTKSPVQAAKVVEQDIARYLTSLGTVNASNTVNVISQVSGQMVTTHFADGQQVQAGDLLAQIDPRPFEIALAQAQGQLAKDQATLNNAKRDLVRYQSLIKSNLISKQDLDTQQSLVQQLEGQVKSDQSSVDSAQLQLNFSHITAPISGRLGLLLINAGNYISAGSTSIVVINQTQPIDVLFTLSEQNISAILKAQKAGLVTLEAWDRNNLNLLAQGQLTSLDNQIDTTTGTIKLKGSFTNQDEMLFPNQFVNIKLKVETLKNALVIPSAALQMDNQGHYVWTVDEQNKATKHRVTVTLEDSQKVVISSGISAGQRVVTDGIDQLTPNMVVEVVSADPPADSKNIPSTDIKDKSSSDIKGKESAKPLSPSGAA